MNERTQSFFHDLRNKITLVNGHLALASLKHPEVDLKKAKNSVWRINEILNDFYTHIKNDFQDEHLESMNFGQLSQFLNEMVHRADGIFPIKCIINADTEFDVTKKVSINKFLLMQAIENIIENSLNAGANEMRCRLKCEANCISMNLFDNGKGLTQDARSTINGEPIIPHGFGLKIIEKNLSAMNAIGKLVKNASTSQGAIYQINFPFVS
jgi:K+-sensing histidine kinase KdpD